MMIAGITSPGRGTKKVVPGFSPHRKHELKLMTTFFP